MSNPSKARTCRACGADISHRDVRTKFCGESCAKARPCLRCGGFKGKDAGRGARYCPTCLEVVNSSDYVRDLERRHAKTKRLSKLERGEYLGRRRTANAPEKTKWCAQCQRFLPFASFASNGGKLNAYCIPCAKDYNHEQRLRRDYGITAERYLELLALQDGRCAICLSKPRTRRLAVDHNHETGEIRGLLCTRCNHGILGKSHDSEKMLQRAVSYLQRPPGVTGSPVPEFTEEQGDLSFIHELLPFLKDGEVVTHPTLNLVAITPRTMMALAQAAGFALIVGDVGFVPDPQLAIDDELLLRSVHASYIEQAS